MVDNEKENQTVNKKVMAEIDQILKRTEKENNLNHNQMVSLITNVIQELATTVQLFCSNQSTIEVTGQLEYLPSKLREIEIYDYTY